MGTECGGMASKPIKAKQANIRLTAEQDRLLKQHCNRTGMTTQAAIIDALKRVIEGF